MEYDFLQYMLQYGGLGRKTSLDYVSRMRFLSNNYLLDENITDNRNKGNLRMVLTAYSYFLLISPHFTLAVICYDRII